VLRLTDSSLASARSVGSRVPLGSSPRRIAARIASARRRYKGPVLAPVHPASEGPNPGIGVGAVDIFVPIWLDWPWSGMPRERSIDPEVRRRKADWCPDWSAQ
jgi:hypothetical protein